MIEAVIISPYLALPLAGILMVVIALHMEHTLEHTAPRSRRRLRIANGWIMLIGIPLLATGSSLINPDTNPRLFTLIWTTTILFLSLALLVALGDVLNTMRLSLRSHTSLRDQFKQDLLDTVHAGSRHQTPSADNPSQETHDSSSA